MTENIDKLQPAVIWISVKGVLKPHYFNLCVAADLPKLEKFFSELSNEISIAYIQQTFENLETLYTTNAKIKGLCDQILILNGLSPEILNVTQITQLCIGFETTGETESGNATLLELNFISEDQQPSRNNTEKVSLMQTLAKIEANLLKTGLISHTEIHDLYKSQPLDYIFDLYKELLANHSKSGTEPVTDKEFSQIFRNKQSTNTNSVQDVLNANLKK